MINQVSLVGNISTEIDMRFTPNGHAVSKFNLAVNDPYDKDHCDFIPIEVWRKQAENTAQFCSKGSKVGVVGKIRIEQYEKDGQKKTFTKVVASQVAFLDTKGSNQQPKPQNNQQQSQPQNNDPFAGSSQEVPFDENSLPF